MQLDKVAAYHKALADPTRIKLLLLLSKSERSGLELAEALGVSPPTVTHHAAKLRLAGLIRERRDKNTVWFSLDEETLKYKSQELPHMVETIRKRKESDPVMKQTQEDYRKSVLRNFFTGEGKLKHIPSQLKKKLVVLEHLVGLLDASRTYEEREMNGFIRQFHEDYATIRREFVVHRFVYRDRETYRINPTDMWDRWDQLS